MTELEYEWEYYTHSGTFYDGTSILQVPGHVEQAIKESKRKETKMTNGEWMAKNRYSFKNITVENGGYIGLYIIKFNTPECLYISTCTGKTSAEALKNWLEMEYKLPILDKEEKAYLSTVIKPFRDRIIKIVKSNYETWEYINIYVKASSGGDYSIMRFPYFSKGKMCKRMKTEKEYTLEELGL